MEDGVKNKLATFAFGTRIFLILLQFLANLLIPDHDAKVFNPPVDRDGFSALDHLVELVLGGFRRWDAVYFTHIAEHGYTFENCAAFFPLFPLTVTFLARCLTFIFIGILHFHTSILLVAVFINCVLFACTAVNLYALGLRIGLSSKISFLSSILFCMNPSSVFMTAPYSEILYMFLLVLALFYLQENKLYTSSLYIGLSIFTRSNGLVGIGFIVHSVILSLFTNLEKIKFPSLSVCVPLVQSITKICISFCICIIPFFAYQYFIFLKFCHSNSNEALMLDHILSYGRNMKYKVLGDLPSSWCTKALPLSYSYIQSHYWGVGFLKYYQFKQIPNFLLAAPVVVCSVKCCLYFFNFDRRLFYGLGLKVNLSKWRSEHHYRNDSPPEKAESEKPRFISKTVVFIFHLAFLVMFGCFFVHIQVLTRMLFSSSPILYWYCGLILGENKCLSKFAKKHLSEFEASSDSTQTLTPVDDTAEYSEQAVHARRGLHLQTDHVSPKFSLPLGLEILNCVHKNWATISLGSKAIIFYFGAYFLIGTIMFSNFLPWT